MQTQPYRREISMQISLPEKVEAIIDTLQDAGFEAYAVGGCVRDRLLNREPNDWDVTTSATPYEVKALFRRTVDTGIKHGTVTVLFGEDGYEVTTYRLDGEYEDLRHPKEVSFTKSLREDLKRRDFTINAMAYNPKDGLVDLFGGADDLENGIIRCVGNAGERFDEDALRILRALRFSAQLGFSVEAETMEAIKERSAHLKQISVERIRDELCKLLLSPMPERLITVAECGMMEVIMPELSAFLQKTGGVVSVLQGLRDFSSQCETHAALTLCWATLLNAALFDGGVTDAKLRRAKVSELLRRLKFDNLTILEASSLAEYSREPVVCEASALRRQMYRMGEDVFRLWLLFLNGERFADGTRVAPELFHALIRMVEGIYEAGDCVSLKMLAVNGADLIAAGEKPGTGLGELLQYLLEQVLLHPEWNEKERLLLMAKAHSEVGGGVGID